jgi:hypothetical protein
LFLLFLCLFFPQLSTESEGGTDEEDDEDAARIEAMHRRQQAKMRESRRQTARQSLMLANLVDKIQPELAEEIIQTDVTPNMHKSGMVFIFYMKFIHFFSCDNDAHSRK